MKPEAVTALGLVAATLTTVSFLPQVLRTVRTRDTRSISVGMYAAFVTGVGLWLIYGLLMQDVPIVVANAITFVLSGIVFLLKLRYG
ncbi:SemiSWEET transporter [Sorangium atrum]|uniref:SemiSWEET transporter n=1 Tax=Sorangium atrum TaxID=2995308 RepID=A0ABT5C8N4_9BACT|nr:SemiSWEET transporter [Sorangium aterium]MDC0682794.1 SemiSWEET transporter [Sorangium aterium]